VEILKQQSELKTEWTFVNMSPTQSYLLSFDYETNRFTIEPLPAFIVDVERARK